MRLARLAMVSIKSSNAGETLDFRNGPIIFANSDAEVSIYPEPNSGDRFIVFASRPVTKDALVDCEGVVSVPVADIRLLQTMITEVLDLITISTGEPHTVNSFDPELGFYDLTEEERSAILGLGELHLYDREQTVRVIGSESFVTLEELLKIDLHDRPGGVRLLAEALSSDHATGRFRDLCRLFERAFGLGPHALVEPSTEYLRPYQALDFSLAEVSGWLDNLRHLATHADRRDQFAVASDVMPVLSRVTFAAYDVVLNKERWRDSSITRRDSWTPSTAPLVTGAAVVEGAKGTLSWQVLDQFGVYPLWLGGEKVTIALPGDWISVTSQERTYDAGTVNVISGSLLVPVR